MGDVGSADRLPFLSSTLILSYSLLLVVCVAAPSTAGTYTVPEYCSFSGDTFPQAPCPPCALPAQQRLVPEKVKRLSWARRLVALIEGCVQPCHDSCLVGRISLRSSSLRWRRYRFPDPQARTSLRHMVHHALQKFPHLRVGLYWYRSAGHDLRSLQEFVLLRGIALRLTSPPVWTEGSHRSCANATPETTRDKTTPQSTRHSASHVSHTFSQILEIAAVIVHARRPGNRPRSRPAA